MLRIITTKITNKECLTGKRSLILIGLAAAVCGGYILFLAVAAPQQLAEATTAATNLVCNGCVGSSDIGDETIQSRDITNGQVGSVDIGTGQVASVDVRDNGITSADLGNVITRVQGIEATVPAGGFASATVDCPSGKILTGGGFSSNRPLQIQEMFALDDNTWQVRGFNPPTMVASLTPYALCV